MRGKVSMPSTPPPPRLATMRPQLYYGSVDDLLTSDHKPVHSVFEIAAKRIIADKRAAVMADVGRRLDAMENRSLPRVDVSELVVHMPDTVYAIPHTHTVTVTNTGDVAAAWRFVPKLEERWYCKTWLTVDPPYGLLAPGEEAAITLTVTVDDAVARDISFGRELASLPPSGSVPGTACAGGMLEDILVLRVERGRDYYLSLSATVLPTAFGCSLAQLARRPEPMRALSLTATATRELNALNEVAVGVPPAGSGGAGSSGDKAKPREAPNLAAGSHSLAKLLGDDELDARDGDSSALISLPSSDASRKGSTVMSVPKEVWRLVDLLCAK
jgi:hypothetical protein